MNSFLSSERFNQIIGKFQTLNPVLVVGDIGIDKYTFGDVKRISPEAPVPVLEVSKEWDKLGLAANVSDNLKSFGVPSTLLGVVGDDSRASLLESLLEEKALKTWGLIRDPARVTTFKERVTTNTQQICRIDYESKVSISSDIEQKVVQRFNDLISTHSGVIVEDYGKGLFTKKVLEETIKSSIDANKILTIDPSRTTPPLWYKGASLLKPNFQEAQLMVESLGYFKEKRLPQIASILVDKLSLKKLVITLGADGLCMLDTENDGDLKTIPTVANEVFDVSGAGDTVISAITSAILSGATLEEASWIGNCAAGVVVGKRGTALCSIDELVDYYKKLNTKLK